MNAKISSYLIGIVMFTFIMIGGISLINIMNEKNGNFINNDKYVEFNDTVNNYNEVTDRLNSISDSLNTEPDQSTFGVLNSLISTAWNTLRTIPALFSFMTSSYITLCIFFGIPSWIPGLLTGIVGIIMVFVIWGAFFQKDM